MSFFLQNVLAWGVAGAVAYYVYVKPQQMQVEEQKVSVCWNGVIAERVAWLSDSFHKWMRHNSNGSADGWWIEAEIGRRKWFDGKDEHQTQARSSGYWVGDWWWEQKDKIVIPMYFFRCVVCRTLLEPEWWIGQDVGLHQKYLFHGKGSHAALIIIIGHGIVYRLSARLWRQMLVLCTSIVVPEIPHQFLSSYWWWQSLSVRKYGYETHHVLLYEERCVLYSYLFHYHSFIAWSIAALEQFRRL